jgi:hypothetical protein
MSACLSLQRQAKPASRQRKRSLHGDILARREEVLPDELLGYPLDSVYFACKNALEYQELERRDLEKRAKTTTRVKKITVRATRTVTTTAGHQVSLYALLMLGSETR